MQPKKTNSTFSFNKIITTSVNTIQKSQIQTTFKSLKTTNRELFQRLTRYLTSILFLLLLMIFTP